MSHPVSHERGNGILHDAPSSSSLKSPLVVVHGGAFRTYRPVNLRVFEEEKGMEPEREFRRENNLQPCRGKEREDEPSLIILGS